MKIAILDKITVGLDLDTKQFEKLGDVVVYDQTLPEELKDRLKDIDIAISNKCKYPREVLKEQKQLKLISHTGTGYNNIDVECAKEMGIAVCNIPAYSTDSVAQHTFAMLFHMMERLDRCHQAMMERSHVGKDKFQLFTQHFFELRGKTWGILGLGNIGRQVAAVAEAFGCNVICCSASGGTYDTTCRQVDLDTLLETSDVLSIHAPMNEYTRHLIGRRQLHQMKQNAILINVGRGGIVVENDLVHALKDKDLAGACIDVFEEEPIRVDSPYLTMKNDDRLLLTPHIAWGALDARQRSLADTRLNIESFLAGGTRNRIV